MIQTRVPLIKISDHKTGLNCDISMENDLSLYKAALLRCYVGIDARLPALVALVKMWPYVCVCVCVCVCVYVLMCVCTFLLYVCMYACVYTCVCVYACTYVFVCI